MVGFKQSIHFLVASRSMQPYTSYLHDQPHASPTSHLAQDLRSCAELQSDHDNVASSNRAFSPTGASAGWSTDDRIGPQCLVIHVVKGYEPTRSTFDHTYDNYAPCSNCPSTNFPLPPNRLTISHKFWHQEVSRPLEGRQTDGAGNVQLSS
ncbi:hypothetical protein Hypma_011186 [Hypsizygus marmoreus]|uniref:Uncharacterized protein n=1 Tax=Hypsizygus marmoreus TaxID=39966 RepID=A0A369JHL6_HYPMA|nr:hypothetical protein Hypma_011186 [Hypsizygus marmoreus]